MIGFEHNNEKYFYVRDLLGDIREIIDIEGNIVVSYEYDAWGNHKVYDGSGMENTDLSFIGNINPFRYKGYYYDNETGWYYLQSRYYSPSLSRFINMDHTSYLEPGNIEGVNLFAYCGNNPVMFLDSTGHSWESFWGGVGNWFQDNWKEVLIGTAFIVGGAVVTALTAGAGVGFMAAFGSALLSSTLQVGISMGTSVIVGGLMSVANGARFFDNIGDSLASGFMWGGIFAGGAQIIGGGFRMAANMGAQTGRNGGIALGKTGIKVLSPDSNSWAKAGGTLLKIGKNTRLDIGAHYGLHLHTVFNSAKWLPSIIKHFPIGAIIAGFIN